jgi:heme exporter protein C
MAMQLAERARGWRQIAAPLGMAAMLAITAGLTLGWAPREASMGDVQRIVYFHVAFAWCGLAASMAMGAGAVMYLVRRRIDWDHWSQAAGEVAWLCLTLTLATGSLWAHEAWNTWWTWEPRLTTVFLLWALIAGYFLVRASIDDPDRKARISAVLAIVSIADVPLIVLATRLFRGMHPVAPEMDGRMQITLAISALSFSAFFAALIALRRRQLRQWRDLDSAERAAGSST